VDLASSHTLHLLVGFHAEFPIPPLALHASLRLVLHQQRESSTATLSFDGPGARFTQFGDLFIAAVGEVLDGKLTALCEHLGITTPVAVFWGWLNCCVTLRRPATRAGSATDLPGCGARGW
jgi:hypothetical protein